MNSRAIALSLLTLGFSGGCAAPVRHAQYAGWEPTPAEIPVVSDAAEAKLRVAQSRALWRAWHNQTLDLRDTGRNRTWDAPGYSYVRAQQRSKGAVDFTLLVVERERVVLRALIEAAPAELQTQPFFDRARPGPHSLWVERGQTVGSHGDGAPLRTIEQLYDECEHLIFQHPSLKPQLYFHPNGILMNCGFSREQCRDCSSVSIQSFSLYRVDDEAPKDDPAKWVCPIAWGVFVPGSQVPEISDEFACYAASPSGSEASLDEACAIDPAACPQNDSAERRQAHWTRWRASACHMWPTRAPTALDLGKPRPLDHWAFPFTPSNVIECSNAAALPKITLSPKGQ